jgi:hypothetical protein
LFRFFFLGFSVNFQEHGEDDERTKLPKEMTEIGYTKKRKRTKEINLENERKYKKKKTTTTKQEKLSTKSKQKLIPFSFLQGKLLILLQNRPKQSILRFSITLSQASSKMFSGNSSGFEANTLRTA